VSDKQFGRSDCSSPAARLVLVPGDADHIVPLSDAQAAIALLPDAELVLRPEESHLGGFATADEVLDFIRSHL
jgi:hypothetical protein